jgi:hypothetical protein
MTLTITLEDHVLAGLQDKAKRQQLSVEQVAVEILVAAIGTSDSELTPLEAAARIQATSRNVVQVRPATESLADLLRAAPDDAAFELEDWQRRWSAVACELAAVTRANEMAEGRGRSN